MRLLIGGIRQPGLSAAVGCSDDSSTSEEVGVYLRNFLKQSFPELGFSDEIQKYIILACWVALWLFVFVSMVTYAMMIPDSLGTRRAIPHARRAHLNAPLTPRPPATPPSKRALRTRPLTLPCGPTPSERASWPLSSRAHAAGRAVCEWV